MQSYRLFRKGLAFIVVMSLLGMPGFYTAANAKDISSFSIFATNSVWLRYQAKVISGDIGVKQAGAGPFLNAQSEVSIESQGFISNAGAIRADTVTIKPGASVNDVYYNELYNAGIVRSSTYTPLALPLDTVLPEFPSPAPGTENHVISPGPPTILGPGSYGDIILLPSAKLILTGGTYHFEFLKMGDAGSKLLFQQPAQVIINGRLAPGNGAVIGPEIGSGTDPHDILIYVNGIDGVTGGLSEQPDAAEIGYNNQLHACIYAPNGTLFVRSGTMAHGALIAKDIHIANNVIVELDSGFVTTPPPAVDNFTAVPQTV